MSQSNQENLLALVERLREAGQREHGIVCEYGEAVNCPADDFRPGPCECGATEHNAAVDAVAKALVDEIKQLPEFDCGSCKREECPHHGPRPERPGPPHGCSAYIGGKS